LASGERAQLGPGPLRESSASATSSSSVIFIGRRCVFFCLFWKRHKNTNSSLQAALNVSRTGRRPSLLFRCFFVICGRNKEEEARAFTKKMRKFSRRARARVVARRRRPNERTRKKNAENSLFYFCPPSPNALS
jgi:hypothetical protein